MKSKLSKKETEEKIKNFFSHIRNKIPEEVKKIKKLAMSHNIKLGDKRKMPKPLCQHIEYNNKRRIHNNNMWEMRPQKPLEVDKKS